MDPLLLSFVIYVVSMQIAALMGMTPFFLKIAIEKFGKEEAIKKLTLASTLPIINTITVGIFIWCIVIYCLRYVFGFIAFANFIISNAIGNWIIMKAFAIQANRQSIGIVRKKVGEARMLFDKNFEGKPGEEFKTTHGNYITIKEIFTDKTVQAEIWV